METANQLLSKIHDIKSHQKHKPSPLSQPSKPLPLPSTMPHSPRPPMEQIESDFDRFKIQPEAPPPGPRYPDASPSTPKPAYGEPRFDQGPQQPYGMPPNQRPGTLPPSSYPEQGFPQTPTQAQYEKPARQDSYPAQPPANMPPPPVR